MRTVVCAELNDGTRKEITVFSYLTIIDWQGKSVKVEDIKFFYFSQEPDYAVSEFDGARAYGV